MAQEGALPASKLFLHGTRREWLEGILLRGAFPSSAGAFLVRAEDFRQGGAQVRFTLSVAVFHAVGLGGWRELERAFSLRVPVEGHLALFLTVPADPAGLDCAPRRAYVETGPGGRVTFEYVRGDDVPALGIERTKVWWISLPVERLQRLLQPADMRPSRCYFGRAGALSPTVVPMNVQRICTRVADEVAARIPSLLSAAPPAAFALES